MRLPARPPEELPNPVSEGAPSRTAVHHFCAPLTSGRVQGAYLRAFLLRKDPKSPGGPYPALGGYNRGCPGLAFGGMGWRLE